MSNLRNVVFAVAGIAGLAGSANATTVGRYFPGGTTNLNSVTDAINLVNATSPASIVAFTSNNVNGIDYNGNDGSFVSSVLGADAASISQGNGAQQFLSGVIEEIGEFVAPVAGTYTFNNNLDDGGGFFVDSGGTPGSGTAVAINNGQHGPQPATGTLTLGAGIHYFQYFYYNNQCCGVTIDGTNNGTGGGIADDGVQILGPGSAPVAVALPEPASISLLGFAGAGLLVRRRRA